MKDFRRRISLLWMFQEKCSHSWNDTKSRQKFSRFQNLYLKKIPFEEYWSFGDLIIVKTWVYDKILQFLVHEKFVMTFHHLLQETKQGNFSEHNCCRHWCDYLRHGRSSLMTFHNVLSDRNRMSVIELIRLLNLTLIFPCKNLPA